MTTTDYTTTLLVDQTPQEVFNAINNVRGWWSEEIEGNTDKLNEEFTYHFEDVHYSKMKIIEMIPDKKVVWLVLDNYFNFIKDQSEWKDTKIIFEISRKDTKTQIRFTHQGLVPGYECYEVCSDAWGNYINHSLRLLITTGKGQPNPKDGRNLYQEDLSINMKDKDFHASIMVDAPAHEAFKSINNVSKWWTENLEGNSQKVNDEFTVRFGDVHVSRQKLVEVIPDKKVEWLVMDSRLNFVKNKQEWKNTRIRFDLIDRGDKTQINFTHQGLVPEYECFEACSDAWTDYLKGSLRSLINTGKGQPTPKETRRKPAKKTVNSRH